MQTVPNPRAYKVALAVILLPCLAFFVYKTLHWPLSGDATFTHYASFLSDHGLNPYQDIGDVNMPGAYGIDWTVMYLFGDGALPWRLFDLALLFIGGSAMYSITASMSRTRRWFPALFAASLFALAHARDGIAQLGQKDLSVAVLLLLACAALFHTRTIHSHRAGLFLGLFTGIACTVQPTAFPFAIGLGLFMAFSERRAARDWRQPLLRTSLGFLLPFLAVALWLTRLHLWSAFLATVKGTMRYHAGVDRHSPGSLLFHSVSSILPLIVASAVLLALRRNYKLRWETAALSLCTLLGLLSYFLQGKGYPCQAYPFLAFLLLLMATQFTAALERSYWEQRIATLALAVGACVLAPLFTFKAISYDGQEDQFATALQRDLTHLGGSALSGHIQCLDTSSGCIGTLYQMQLIQPTSLMYDEFLFGPEKNGVVARNRDLFWRQLQKSAPDVFVVTEHLYPDGPDGFDKLFTWPLFSDYLRDNYLVFSEFKPTRTQNWDGRATVPAGYRIYIARDPAYRPFTDLFEVTDLTAAHIPPHNRRGSFSTSAVEPQLAVRH